MNSRNYKNALILPATQDFTGNPKEFINGIYANESDGYTSVMRNGKVLVNRVLQDAYIASHTAQTIKGRWFFAGPLHSHFGHFLSEGIHRLWYFRKNRHLFDGVIFLPIAGFRLDKAKFVEDVLDIFDISMDCVKLVDRLCCVEHLTSAMLGRTLGGGQEPWYNQELSFVLDKYAIAKPQQKVVISRTHYKLKGRVAGTDYFNRKLVANGFSIVCPEELALKQQISTLLSAKMIFMEEGSAVHIAELLPDHALQAKVFLLCRRKRAHNFIRLLEDKCASPPIVYQDVGDELMIARHDNMMTVLEVPKSLFNALKEQDFLPWYACFSELAYQREEVRDLAYFISATTHNEWRKLNRKS